MNLANFWVTHCSAYLVSIVFHFSLKGKTKGLIVTVPCHCSSLTFSLILVLFYFGELKEEHNFVGVIMKALLAANFLFNQSLTGKYGTV